jgi:2-polyprenyl-3-methyl-5-hydroxy-6-metoxy-1,4-benzoquinol methylase
MPLKDWEALNDKYHSSLFTITTKTSQAKNDNPEEDVRKSMRMRGLNRLKLQADIIALLAGRGLLSRSLPWIDFGCGDGTLANLLMERGFPTKKFDKYVFRKDKGYLTENDLDKYYDLVINTGVFEHIRKKETLDEILGLVADKGVLALHVLVCESVPENPTWFYLLPVHCTFFTNKSMQILFEQWDFSASIYHAPSRMWFWFKKTSYAIEQFMKYSERSFPEEFYYKKAFLDFWK